MIGSPNVLSMASFHKRGVTIRIRIYCSSKYISEVGCNPPSGGIVQCTLHAEHFCDLCFAIGHAGAPSEILSMGPRVQRDATAYRAYKLSVLHAYGPCAAQR